MGVSTPAQVACWPLVEHLACTCLLLNKIPCHFPICVHLQFFKYCIKNPETPIWNRDPLVLGGFRFRSHQNSLSQYLCPISSPFKVKGVKWRLSGLPHLSMLAQMTQKSHAVGDFLQSQVSEIGGPTWMTVAGADASSRSQVFWRWTQVSKLMRHKTAQSICSLDGSALSLVLGLLYFLEGILCTS